MKKLVGIALLCIFVVAYWSVSSLRSQGPGPPPYVGDWTDLVNDSVGTLHINEPAGFCRCPVGDSIVNKPSAAYFNSVQTAGEAGFTMICPECCNKGTMCRILFQADSCD